MELVPVTKKDLKALTEFIAKNDPTLKNLDTPVLEKVTLDDPDTDGNFLLQGLEGGKPVGVLFAVAKRQNERKVGYIKYFLVHPKQRRKSFGTQLFSELERRFQKRETREVVLGRPPFPSFFGGVSSLDTASICFLLKRGYERRGDSIMMRASLKALAQGIFFSKEYKFRRAKAQDLGAGLQEMLKKYPHWESEIKWGAEKGNMILVERGGNVVAFCAWGWPLANYFGPLGILDSERGKGLGKEILRQTFDALKKKGVQEVLIDQVASIPYFARHASALIHEVRWHFSKQI